MQGLWLYRALARLPLLSYRGKIMAVAFVGTHVPLLALIVYLVAFSSPDIETAITIGLVALGATLGGTALCLVLLHQLLSPVRRVSDGLRRYITAHELPDLPTGYRDEAGTLMADASFALHKLDETMARLVNVDTITGLPSHHLTLSAIQRRIEQGGPPCAVAVLGVVNEPRMTAALGHEAANRVLWGVGQRLQEAVGYGGICGTIGRGRFVALIELDEPGDPARHIGSLAAAVTEPSTRDSVAMHPEVCAGVALHPADGGSAVQLVDQASSALDRASPTESGRVAFFSNAAHEAERLRLEMERDLRLGLDRGELELFYQPAVDAETGAIVGAEALLRWNRPDRGVVPSDVFVSIAEQSGLIVAIGRWVMEQGCRERRAWTGLVSGEFRLAMNLSPRQFYDTDIVAELTGTLARHGLAAGSIELELTETTAMREPHAARVILDRLRGLGIPLVVDDFGRGYSHLELLRLLPFDKLKVDRAFVRGVDSDRHSQAICHSVIALAQGLGLAVQAEGVETEQEVAYLRDSGCRIFQGNHFSPPLQAAEFADLLRRGGVAAGAAT